MNASGAVRESKFTYLKMLYILALELPLTMNFALYTIFSSIQYTCYENNTNLSPESNRKLLRLNKCKKWLPFGPWLIFEVLFLIRHENYHHESYCTTK